MWKATVWTLVYAIGDLLVVQSLGNYFRGGAFGVGQAVPSGDRPVD
jgi:hypothetical protein